MSGFIIYLPSPRIQSGDEALCLRYIAISNEKRVAATGAVPVGELLTLAANQKVTVVVPASCLSWHEIQMPKGILTAPFWRRTAAPKILNLLDGLLEEQILDAPEALHFALEPKAGLYETQIVAVCDKSWLRKNLETLRYAGLAIHRIVPEFEPIPREDAQKVAVAKEVEEDAASKLEPREIYVLGEADSPTVVQVTPTLVRMMPLTAGTAKLGLVNGATKIWAEPAVTSIAENAFKQEILLFDVSQYWSRLPESNWNLAQFDVMGAGQSSLGNRTGYVVSDFFKEPAYRPARLALAALIVINVLGLNVTAWMMQHQMNKKQNEIYQMLRTTFPDITTVVNAPIQMNRAVAQLVASHGQLVRGDMEAMLDAYGEATQGAAAPTGEIDYAKSTNQLTFKNGQLPDDQLQGLQKELASRGYQVKNSDGDLVMGEKT